MGLGAPHWEPEARGTIVGLTRGTTRAHLVRAALEAMAFGTADVLHGMRAASGVPFETLRVDGGASANGWLMQFQADVLGVPVERPDMVETTALGAAGLAGIAAGVWKDADAFLATRRFDRFAPGAGASAAARRRRRVGPRGARRRSPGRATAECDPRCFPRRRYVAWGPLPLYGCRAGRSPCVSVSSLNPG